MIDYYTDNIYQRRVGFIVQHDFKKLLELNVISECIINKLQNLDYCKKVFNVNYPVLLKVKYGINEAAQRKDALGRDRYYATPLIINNEKYFLTSQWYDKNKEKVIDFIKTYNHFIDN